MVFVPEKTPKNVHGIPQVGILPVDFEVGASSSRGCCLCVGVGDVDATVATVSGRVGVDLIGHNLWRA